MTAVNRIPCTVITGFLGAGKTTLIRNVLENSKGKRLALPNSRILIHQPATEGGYGQSSDLEIQAKEIMRIRTLMEGMLADNTGQSIEKISHDIERDKYLTAEEAVEYGIVDDILSSLKDVPH